MAAGDRALKSRSQDLGSQPKVDHLLHGHLVWGEKRDTLHLPPVEASFASRSRDRDFEDATVRALRLGSVFGTEG